VKKEKSVKKVLQKTAEKVYFFFSSTEFVPSGAARLLGSSDGQKVRPTLPGTMTGTE